MPQDTWRRRLTELGARLPLAAPAERSTLAATERALALPLPAELRALLAQCDGVHDRYGTEIVWRAEELAIRNDEFRRSPEFRDLYMPFDAVLFFGDAGNGDRYFHRLLGGEVRDPDVYVWDHETDSRVWKFGGLEAFLGAVLRATSER